jgi:hypothetical protein
MNPTNLVRAMRYECLLHPDTFVGHRAEVEAIPSQVEALIALCDAVGATLSIHTPKNVVAAYESAIEAGVKP